VRKRPFTPSLPAIIIVIIFLPTLQLSCRPKPPRITPTPPPTVTPSVTATPEQLPPSGPESLANIVYLGEGSGQFTTPTGTYFLIKRRNPFRFEPVYAATYQAVQGERVWRISGSLPIKVYEEEADFGNVWAGCTISYVQIDDDDDSRRNRWFLDGNMIYQMAQGMVVYGSFTVTTNGRLTLYAADSIGANIDLTCPPEPTQTPFATPLPPRPSRTPPAAATPTAVSTTPPNIVPNITLTPSYTPDASVTTAPPNATGLPTQTPITAVTATITPTPSPTVPTGPAYTRFNFEVAGHVGRDGFCYMRRDTGDLLLIWQMQDGWTDSATHPNADADGWIEVYIPHVSVYVEVFCDGGDSLVRMDIYNGIEHPDGRFVGWLTRGVKNAIEIGWP
jgi:hypothetical protein